MHALDLKYRPRKFCDVIGNHGVVKLLLRRSSSGTLSGRSMMFGGPKGCGKTSLARITAMAIVCDGPENGEPCGTCVSCESVIHDSSLNIDEFDAATQGTVDRIRAILDDLEYGSVDGKPKVVILDEAQRLSKAAQDALLKSIEDRRFVVILCTTEPHKIGEAIRSRLEEYPVSPPQENEIVSRLESICKAEKIDYELDALSIVARYHKCCPRICVSSLDTLRTLGGATVLFTKELFRYTSMEALVNALRRIDSEPSAAFDDFDRLFSSEGVSWVRDNMIAAIASSLRTSVGAKATYPVATSFLSNSGIRWGDLARALGSLDRPTSHDVEAAIVSTISGGQVSQTNIGTPSSFSVTPPVQPVIHKSPQPQQPYIHPPKTETVLPRTSKRTLEIDGVIYTNDERLTSLDHKIEPGGHIPISTSLPMADVNLDKTKVPIPEKEFSRLFVQRTKRDRD